MSVGPVQVAHSIRGAECRPVLRYVDAGLEAFRVDNHFVAASKAGAAVEARDLSYRPGGRPHQSALHPERNALMHRRVIQLRRVDHDHRSTAARTEVQHLFADSPLDFVEATLDAVDSDLKLRVVHEARCQHGQDLFGIGQLAHDAHRQLRAAAATLAQGLAAQHERTRPRLGADDEGSQNLTAPGLHLVLVGKAEQAVAPDPVAPICAARPRVASGRELDVGALVLQPVVAQGHPALLELRWRHAVPVVCHGERATDLGGQNQIHPRRPRIPSIGDEFGQGDLRHMGHLPEFAQQVVVLEQRVLQRLVRQPQRRASVS